MKKENIKKILDKVAVIIVIILLVIFIVNISKVTVNEFEQIVDASKLQIIYFDVGEADSTLIMNDGMSILIDGGNDSDGERLVKYIKSQNISKIDTIIATHMHADHIGGLDDIIDNFEIGKVYMPDTINTDKQVEELLDAMERKKLKYEVPKIGDEFNNGKATCEIMSIDNTAKNLNNSSIVVQLNYLEQKYLFMGDSEKEVENSREWNKVNVLKVGHHGSDTSSTERFLRQVNPDIAIISVGMNNQYNHPSYDVLGRLQKLNTKIYRTDIDGSLLLESDGKENTIRNIRTRY